MSIFTEARSQKITLTIVLATDSAIPIDSTSSLLPTPYSLQKAKSKKQKDFPYANPNYLTEQLGLRADL